LSWPAWLGEPRLSFSVPFRTPLPQLSAVVLTKEAALAQIGQRCRSIRPTADPLDNCKSVPQAIRPGYVRWQFIWSESGVDYSTVEVGPWMLLMQGDFAMADRVALAIEVTATTYGIRLTSHDPALALDPRYELVSLIWDIHGAAAGFRPACRLEDWDSPQYVTCVNGGATTSFSGHSSFRPDAPTTPPEVSMRPAP
jgi:hypothetical protein